MKKKMFVKTYTALVSAVSIGLMLSGCGAPDNEYVKNDMQQSSDDSRSNVAASTSDSDKDVEPGKYIARIEDAPGPGEENKTENYVLTTFQYYRILDWYGVNIISVTNPYIYLEDVPENPKVRPLMAFVTDDNKEKALAFASSMHSDWVYDGKEPDYTTYLYYEDGILSGIYPALKYNFGEDDYVLLDPVYDRLIDGSTQTLRAYLYNMVAECIKDHAGYDYEVDFIDNDTICFAEGTTLKDALNVYCAYIDQGASPELHNLYGADYRHRYVYGYTGDGYWAGYYACGFSGVETNTSTFLNIVLISDEIDYHDFDLEGYGISMFGEIDKILAECEIYPFYDKYLEDKKNWEKDNEYTEFHGIE